jgi:hypothetical protein
MAKHMKQGDISLLLNKYLSQMDYEMRRKRHGKNKKRPRSPKERAQMLCIVKILTILLLCSLLLSCCGVCYN